MDIFYWTAVVVADGFQHIKQYPILLSWKNQELPLLLVKEYPRYLHLALSSPEKSVEYLLKTTPPIKEPKIIDEFNKRRK